MPPKGIEKFEIARPNPGETPKPGELLLPGQNLFNQSPFRELFFHEDIFPDQLWDSEENRDIGFVSAIDLFIHHIDIEKDTLSYIFDKEVKTFEDQEKNETRFRAREFEIRHHLKDDLDPIATTLAIMENLRIFFNDHPYAFKYLHEHLTGRDAEYTPWGNPKRAQIDYVPTYTKYARNQELSTQEDILVGIGQEVTGLSTIEDILAALPPKSKENRFHRYGKSQKGSMSHRTFID